MNRIGKPQKTKKHKKLKSIDPFYKGDRPKTKDEHIFNQRPKNDDEQEFSHSMREFMSQKNQVKYRNNFEGSNKKSKNKFKQGDNYKIEKGMTRPLKPIPDFTKGKHESESSYMARINRQTHDLIAKRQMEDKYEIDIEQKRSGEIVVHQRSIEKDSDTPGNSTVSKKKRRLNEFADKKKNKKRRKQEEEDCGFESLQDEVAFGEVAMAPPTITAKLRKAPVKEKSSKIKSLKLNKLSKPTDKDTTQRETQKPKDKQKIGFAKKRKHLAPAEKIKADMRREEAIAKYRQMKLKKGHTTDFANLELT